MLFRVSSHDAVHSTHLGVLEFIAEEGRVYLPEWVYAKFQLSLGAMPLVLVQNVTIQLGTFVKIQPQSVNFLEITDPKAVLEKALNNYSALTVNDIIAIEYNDQQYRLLVMEVKPESRTGAISIVETDLSVDFAAPLGYVEPAPDHTPRSHRFVTRNSIIQDIN